MIRPSERQTSLGFWLTASLLLHGAVLMAAPVSLPREADPGTRLRVALETPRPVELSAGRKESQQPPTPEVAPQKHSKAATPTPPQTAIRAAVRPPPTRADQPLEPAPETRPAVPPDNPKPEVADAVGKEPSPTAWIPLFPPRVSQAGSSAIEEMCFVGDDVLGESEGTGTASSIGQSEGHESGGEGRSGLRRPLGMSLARPDYPEESRIRGEEGTVTLRVLVDTDGDVAQVKVAKSSGFQPLDRAAARGARRWRFEAARRGGVAIESWVEIGVVFRLEDQPS